jgi:RNA polymerase sigma factor (sigma-70 family)
MSLHLYRHSRPGLADGTAPAGGDPNGRFLAVAPGDDLPLLVAAARVGDERAWARLVTRFDPRLRHVARSFRLSPEDVEDVVQATWAQALTALGALRDPRAVGAWLSTMTRRECLRSLQRQTREVLSDSCEPVEASAPDDPERDALAAVRRDALRAAIGELPARQRALITALADENAGDYRVLSARLQMPVGSIGPIRARGLERLRRDRRLVAFAPGA